MGWEFWGIFELDFLIIWRFLVFSFGVLLWWWCFFFVLFWVCGLLGYGVVLAWFGCWCAFHPHPHPPPRNNSNTNVWIIISQCCMCSLIRKPKSEHLLILFTDVLFESLALCALNTVAYSGLFNGSFKNILRGLCKHLYKYEKWFNMLKDLL